MTVLITGASGFIGSNVISALLYNSLKVRVACRQGTKVESYPENVEVVYLTGSGTNSADWADAVAQCSAVIHLAARAHVLRDQIQDPVEPFGLQT